MLPSTYSPLTYIESSGTQYIDTGYSIGSTTRIVAKMGFTSTPSANVFLFGTSYYTGTASSRQNFGLAYRTTATGYAVYNGGQWSAFQSKGTLDTSVHTFELNRSTNKFYVDDTEYSLTTNSISNIAATMLIFASRQSGSSSLTADYFSSARLYSFQIYNSGTLIRDFQPCARVSDGTIGLYDLVNDVFYENQGTGDFTPSEAIVQVLIHRIPTAGGTVTPGQGYYPVGKEITFTFTPNDGYYFSGGAVRRSGQYIADILTNPWTYTIPGMVTIEVYFLEGSSVDVTVDPSGVGTVSGGGSFRPGSIVSLSAIPTNDGYLFDRFTIGSTDYYDNPHSLIVGDQDISVTAHFKQREFIDAKTDWYEYEYLNKNDLNRIENNLYILSQLYGTTPNMKVWEYGDIPTVEQFERIIGLCEDIFDVTHHGYIPAYPINEAIKIQELERFIQQNYDAYYE